MTVQIAKLSLVDGRRRPAPPEMGSVSAHGGTLYVFAEVSAPVHAWDEASQEIVAKALDVFASSRLGVTSTLQTAVKAVNDMLLARNERLPEADQVWAGLNTAFIQDDALFLAQAGPAMTYITRGDAVTRYPKSFDDLQTGRSEALTPLGEQPEVKCRLARFTLEPDDLIVLTATRLPTFGSSETIAATLNQPHADAVIEALAELVSPSSDFASFVIHWEPATPIPITVPATALPAATGADEDDDEDEWDDDSWYDDWDDWEEEEPEPEPPPPPPSKKSPVSTASKPPSKKNRATPPRPATPVASDAPRASTRGARPTPSRREPPPPQEEVPPRAAPPHVDPQGARALRATTWQEALRRLGAGLVAVAVALLATLSAIVGWLARTLAPRARALLPALDRLTHRLWTALQNVGQAFLRILRQVLPGDHPDPARRPAPPPPPGDGSSFLRGATLLLPLLLLGGALLLWSLRGGPTPMPGTAAPAGAPVATEAPTGDFAALVAEAETFIAQAQSVDESTAQGLVAQALARLDEAAPLAPTETEEGRVAALQAQAQGLLSQADTIARPPTRRLVSIEGESQPRTLVFGGRNAFALDPARAVVYRLLPDQSPGSLESVAPLLAAQQRLSEGVTVGAPVAVTWVPAGGGRDHDGLLILTSTGQMFDYDADSGIIRQLFFSSVAGEVQVSEGYGGNLYLLDRANRQIWKYVPDEAGEYPGAPAGWLTETGQGQIGSPRDMAIDGYIFLLDESGEVGRFQVGQLKAGFALDPVTPPLTQPVALAKAPPETTDLYVADGQRVVRFDQNGRFLVEYRAPQGTTWGTIRDIAIDEVSEALYVLSDTGVYVVDLRNTRRAPAAPTEQESQP